MSIFSICGFGLIGRQRYEALKSLGIDDRHIFVFDPKLISKKSKNEYSNLSIVDNIQELHDLKPNYLIIATPHSVAPYYVSEFGNSDVRILLEKPMGRNLIEAKRLVSLISNASLSIGFNYRFMPGVSKLKSLLQSNLLGEINSINVEIGHGGSPEDAKSWKLNPEISGGGALLDPGIHILDLLNFLFPEYFSEKRIESVQTWSGFWNTGIEENVRILGTFGRIPFSISISLVSWKTKFRIEVIGNDAYFEVTGRGRSDGPQKFVFGKRWGWKSSGSQLESEETGTLAVTDNSLFDEVVAWVSEDVRVATGVDGLKSMEFYQSIKNKF